MRFLSEEWAQAVTEGLNASEDFKQAAAKTSTVIQQVVTGAPDAGELRYWLRIDAGTATLGTGDNPDADITVTQSYDTAVALAKGELNGVSAYMSGKLQVSNVMKAMSLQGPLQALAPVIRDVPCEY